MTEVKRKTIDLPKDTAKKLQYAAVERETTYKKLLETIVTNWVKDNCPK